MNRTFVALLAAPLLTFLSACRTETAKPEVAPPAASASVAAVAAPSAAPSVVAADSHPVAPASASDTVFPKKLGAAIEGKTDTGTLSSIATHASSYKGKTIATSGTVKAVCQHMGCWMELTDGKKSAMIRMHDHAFFVPKSANGRQARVEGKVVLMKDGKECDDMSAANASMELDATGVEIL